MDAYDIADKIKNCWMALYPKHSGVLPNPTTKIKVLVSTEYGYREVVGVKIVDGSIELELDKE
jgi:hypothetical protein